MRAVCKGSFPRVRHSKTPYSVIGSVTHLVPQYILRYDLGDFSHYAHFSGASKTRPIYCVPMNEEQKKKVAKAFKLALRPIVKMLLRYGIGYSEFAEIVKTVFVDVGSSDYGIRGRPTNISRVAVMTGLTRKEVRRLRTKLESGDDSISVKSTPITEIIHRWHAEDEFLDEAGRPAVLPFNGDGLSFSELVRRFGGDVPPGAMRTELKRVGAVVEEADGELRVVRRTVIPEDDTENIVTGIVHAAYPLLSVLSHNSDPDRNDEGLAQYTAFSVNIDKKDMTRLRRICRDRLSDYAESFDDLFMAYESVNDTESRNYKGQTVAVGLYYFEERDKRVSYTW